MKTTEKKMHNFCVRVDEPTANQIQKLAEYYQRTASDLLRLLLAPALRQQWAEMEREQHKENQERPTLAKFTK